MEKVEGLQERFLAGIEVVIVGERHDVEASAQRVDIGCVRSHLSAGMGIPRAS
jgi:hypothetical protein